MKEFLPTFTFGFLMAQLFPGATAVLSISCGFITFVVKAETSVIALFARVGNFWFGTLKSAIVFFFVSTAMGILLHGLDWLTLARMENEYDGIRSFPFHKWPIALQFLLAPFNIVYELLMLINASDLRAVTMEDNAASIDATLVPNLNYLQDFYLHFAQFFIHMSYALLIGLVSFGLIVLEMGLTIHRVTLLILIYLVLSVFFLMGRAQLVVLFLGENQLVSRTPEPRLPAAPSFHPVSNLLSKR
ncbi:MAG: hypothetical protein AABM67_09340 [Acidobacteriota bacterium]